MGLVNLLFATEKTPLKHLIVKNNPFHMVIMEYASKTREGAFDHETAHVKSGKHH